MSITIPAPEVTADTYDISGENFQVMVIKIRESRGRSWATAVVARVPSRSNGDEHHVRVYRPTKNAAPKCTCLAGINGKLCWAVKKVAIIADANGFWDR